jgi:hypothetical protein
MMRWRKVVMKELGFFYPRQTYFIYKYTLMGLRRGKVQSTSTCRCSGYRGIPVHLLLDLFNGLASAQG